VPLSAKARYQTTDLFSSQQWFDLFEGNNFIDFALFDQKSLQVSEQAELCRFTL